MKLLSVSVLVVCCLLWISCDAKHKHKHSRVHKDKKSCPQHLPRGGILKAFGDSCFRFEMTKTRSHHNAEKACQHHGGTLAVVNSHAIEKFIEKELAGTHSRFWLGLKLDEDSEVDTDSEDVYGWGRLHKRSGESNDSDDSDDKSSDESSDSSDSDEKKHGHKSGKSSKSIKKSGKNHTFKWADGSKMVYSNFASITPAWYKGLLNNKCVLIDGKHLLWHPASCDKGRKALHHYICQYPRFHTSAVTPTHRPMHTGFPKIETKMPDTSTDASTVAPDTTTVKESTRPTQPLTTESTGHSVSSTSLTTASPIASTTRKMIHMLHPHVIEPERKVISIVSFV